MQRRILLFVLVLILLVPAATTGAQSGAGGVEVTCPDGRTITNGAEIIINLRPGFTYTATALGIDGFDPVMAFLEEGVVRECVDDSSDAAPYTADLPTTGPINASGFNSQLIFGHNQNSFADLSLVVGGYQGASGEFLLIIEGMSYTNADAEGDPFVMRITENMFVSGVDPTVYLMTVNPAFDPLIRWVNSDGETIAQCDDAGSEDLCDGPSADLGASFIARTQGRTTASSSLNAMLNIGLSQFGPSLDWNEEWFLRLLMTSFQQQTFGEYVVGFHIGVSDQAGSDDKEPEGGEGGGDPGLPTPGQAPGGGEGGEGGGDPGLPTPDQSPGGGEGGGGFDLPTPGQSPGGGEGQPPAPTQAPPTGGGQGGSGATITCPNGAEIVNAVRVVVNMRPGFTYTATALGMDGFDPVMAVADENGNVLCADDAPDAASYSANLPSTGLVNSSSLNVQMPFSHNYDDFHNISIFVAGVQGDFGQFVLILEGMAVTPADGAGDPFVVQLTPNMVSADTYVYMMGIAGGFDPLMRWVDTEGEVIADCDDAGGSLCMDGTVSLAGASLSRSGGRSVQGDSTDPMLIVPTSQLAELDFANSSFFLNFQMSSYGSSTGDYVVAFHFTIGQPPRASGPGA